ncbi:MarR family transcriptional regulator [Streptomyces sp. ICBB 8177]|uniref:MarR family winged helix-turn-helix transcriptional regulator n=1 Tax=Streptomyces sp. ICBB 8177 TaxID=563922 RepID=UPI000D677C64|nr:MarR family transcriptional regulator [Streptomyces sp. ICBB 8177]PWI43111.1 MarR family transcriptional regulator [Streptomyces sp. ICBB 8177]
MDATRVTADPTAQTAEQVWRNLHTLLHETHDRRKEVGAALGMSFNRVKALRRIARGPITLRALADWMVIDAPYATLIVDDLARRGLVERTANPADGRSKLVRLTEAGEAEASRADAILGTPPDALLSLPPEDLAALDRIVGKLLG